jgi:hypothetical protein
VHPDTESIGSLIVCPVSHRANLICFGLDEQALDLARKPGEVAEWLKALAC